MNYKNAVWVNTNKLTLNVNKIKCHNIYTKRENAEITINRNIIEQVKYTKCLGVHIDEHLSWTIYINNYSKQITRYVGMLTNQKNSPIEDFVLFVNNISSAILCYVMVEQFISKLKLLQIRAIKLIQNANSVFSKLKVLIYININ